MADIKKIKLPRSSEAYNLVDDSALHEEDASRFDSAGAAATVKTEVIGTSGDASSASTIYGVKKYADEKVAGLGAVLNFKGVKDTKAQVDAELTNARVGDVWLCKDGNAEYVCVEDSDGSNKRFEKLGFDVQLSGYVTTETYNAHKHTVTMAGSNQASAVSGTASFTADKVVTSATSANLAVSKTGTVAFTGDHSSKSALGVNATFTTSVTPSTTNIKATATGATVGATGSATCLTGVKVSASDSVLGANTTFNVTGGALTNASPASWTGASQAAWSGEVDENGVLTIGWTPNNLGTFTPNVVGSVSAISVTPKTDDLVTAATAVSGNGTATAITGVEMTAQPTIALATNATAGAGVISVATGITSAETEVNSADTVSAITGLATLSDTIGCELNGAASSGVAYVSGVTRAAVSGTISGTAAAQTWAQGETTVSTPV